MNFLEAFFCCHARHLRARRRGHLRLQGGGRVRGGVREVQEVGQRELAQDRGDRLISIDHDATTLLKVSTRTI